MPIKILEATLQNQIAAGEVLERPASALKELLENSLDAKAKSIFVSLDGGGRRIVIQDDGEGIPAEELELALTRHATSKIASIEDLTTLYSFGFRGEALPSIASVSRLSLSSITKDQDSAARVNVEFGRIDSPLPTALGKGTKIELDDLFANVPARLKFMKTPATELKRCQDIFSRVCLAHLDVDFELEIGGRPSWHFFAGQNLLTRLQTLWPPQITDKLLAVDHSFARLKIRGYVGAPETAQARADRILFYVNNRPVQNKLLLQALRQGYKGRLLTKEYPQAILFITMPPEMVDVNAHPAKSEVRFRDEKGLFSFFLHALEKPLAASNISFSAENTFPAKSSSAQPVFSSLPDPRQEQEKFHATRSGASLFGDASPWDNLPPSRPRAVAEPQAAWEPGPQPAFFPPPQAAQMPQPQSALPDIHVQPQQPAGQTDLKCLGQIANTYLILTCNDRLLLMDQHAAHERILFHRFRNQEKPNRTRLAIPLEIPLHPAHIEQLEQVWEQLTALGFLLERPSPQLLRLVALPSLLESSKAKEFLESVLQGKETTLDNMWAMLACRSAIKAGDHLEPNDIQHLLEQWLNCPQKEFCPHGRPSVLDFDCRELEKMFKRK